MSFFDEADEPQPTRQETRRPFGGGRPPRGSGRPPGGSRRPPRSPQEQQVQTRRLVAVTVVVVIVILIAVLIAGSGGDAGALKKYNASVSGLISRSTTNARYVLGPKVLESGNLTGISQALANAEGTARDQLSKARSLHAPSQLAGAQSALVYVMQLRQQALLTIANNAQKAANKLTSRDAVYNISLGTSQLYSSDVIYKTFVATDIAKALNAASIPIGNVSGGQQINPGQVVPDLGWLQSTWIADKIGAHQSTAQANANNDQPNLTHGDQLNYVTVGSSQLYNGGTYTLPASEARTWVLSVTDGGQTAENAVGCSVKLQNVSDSGTSTISTIAAGGSANCTVTLPSTPPKGGPYSVTATVEKVPGEKNLTNNTATFTVTFD